MIVAYAASWYRPEAEVKSELGWSHSVPTCSGRKYGYRGAGPKFECVMEGVCAEACRASSKIVVDPS